MGSYSICNVALTFLGPVYVTLGKSLFSAPQFPHLWGKGIDSPGPPISDNALDFFGFVSGAKIAPIFWLKLLSNFQLVKVQCWLPFSSKDVCAKICTITMASTSPKWVSSHYYFLGFRKHKHSEKQVGFAVPGTLLLGTHSIERVDPSWQVGLMSQQ